MLSIKQVTHVFLEGESPNLTLNWKRQTLSTQPLSQGTQQKLKLNVGQGMVKVTPVLSLNIS